MGNFYSSDGVLIYAGEFLDSKRHGLGAEFWLDGLAHKFLGNFKNNQYEGKGKLFYPDKNVEYDGEFLNGKKHGKGIKNRKNSKNANFEQKKRYLYRDTYIGVPMYQI